MVEIQTEDSYSSTFKEEEATEAINGTSAPRSCWFMTKFFCAVNCKDIKRKKCNFCLAFCSVFTVVLSTLIINTIIGFGPILFLGTGE